MSDRFLLVGEPAPRFIAASTTNPRYHFDSVAGRYIVLCFLRSAADAASQRILSDFAKIRALFDDTNCCFFGVSTDPADRQHDRLHEQIPGIRFFWDFEQQISQQFGVLDRDRTYHPCSYILDERLRVLAVVPFGDRPEQHVSQVANLLAKLPILPSGTAAIQAPILVVPRIFEPELCRDLIAYYTQHGGEDSGFMREINGRTVYIADHSFKRRRDQEILDQDLLKAAMHRIHDRLVPEIHRAFQFQATRIERHIIACYNSTSGGFFSPHRDNTTKGTAHRRFAVSLNLNTGEYEGGCLRFPEFGRQTYTAPAGGAVVFSCSLLHEATPVTQGDRYAYLPFLYDDAAKKIREINQQFIGAADESADEVPPSGKPPSVRSKAIGFQASTKASKKRR